MSKSKIFIVALILLAVVVVFAAVSNSNKSKSTKSKRAKNSVSRTVNKNQNGHQRMEEMARQEIEMLDRRIQTNPNDAHAYSRRAALKQRIHDMEGAAEDANKALQIDPNDKYAEFVKKTLQPRTR